jgi:hypothetical protein
VRRIGGAQGRTVGGRRKAEAKRCSLQAEGALPAPDNTRRAGLSYRARRSQEVPGSLSQSAVLRQFLHQNAIEAGRRTQRSQAVGFHQSIRTHGEGPG